MDDLIYEYNTGSRGVFKKLSDKYDGDFSHKYLMTKCRSGISLHKLFAGPWYHYKMFQTLR